MRASGSGLPVPYYFVMGVLALLAVVSALIAFGVPPFDNLWTFIATGSIIVLVYLVFGILGGLFVGMVIAHRVLANRTFTPFERDVLLALGEIRERLDHLEAARAPRPGETVREREPRQER